MIFHLEPAVHAAPSPYVHVVPDCFASNQVELKHTSSMSVKRALLCMLSLHID